MKLKQGYPSEKLYTVVTAHKAEDPMELTVAAGDLLALIVQKDPMGSSERWYMDCGSKYYTFIRRAPVSCCHVSQLDKSWHHFKRSLKWLTLLYMTN